MRLPCMIVCGIPHFIRLILDVCSGRPTLVSIAMQNGRFRSSISSGISKTGVRQDPASPSNHRKTVHSRLSHRSERHMQPLLPSHLRRSLNAPFAAVPRAFPATQAAHTQDSAEMLSQDTPPVPSEERLRMPNPHHGREFPSEAVKQCCIKAG